MLLCCVVSGTQFCHTVAEFCGLIKSNADLSVQDFFKILKYLNITYELLNISV